VDLHFNASDFISFFEEILLAAYLEKIMLETFFRIIKKKLPVVKKVVCLHNAYLLM